MFIQSPLCRYFTISSVSGSVRGGERPDQEAASPDPRQATVGQGHHGPPLAQGKYRHQQVAKGTKRLASTLFQQIRYRENMGL